MVTDADGRTEEVRAEAVAAAQQEESLKAAIAEKEADMAAAAAERELQAGGEVRELQAATDEQSKQCAAAFLVVLVFGHHRRIVWSYGGFGSRIKLPGKTSIQAWLPHDRCPASTQDLRASEPHAISGPH